MKRLLIFPILLWAGLIVHAQSYSPGFAPADARSANGGLSTPDNIVISNTELNPKAETPASNTFRKKAIIKNGIYQGYRANGELQFSATLKKSRLNGAWKSWYPGGEICDSGRFVRDEPDGEWRGWYPDGTLRYLWHFSAAKYFSLKDEMMHQPRHNFFRIAQLPLNEGIRYFKTDYLFGQSTHTSSFMFRGKTLQQNYFDPEDVRKRVDRNTTNNNYIPPFPECLFHGAFIAYYPDGRIREEGIYINGMRDGLWEEHNIDGWKSRGSYHYGKKSGEWRTYNSNGKLLSMKRYNNSGMVTDSHDFQAME